MRAFGLDVVVLRDVRRLRCYIGASIASRGRALRVVAAAAALYGVVARAGVRGAALRPSRRADWRVLRLCADG